MMTLFTRLSLTLAIAISASLSQAHDSTGGDSAENYTCAELQMMLAEQGKLEFYTGTILGIPAYQVFYATPEILVQEHGTCPARRANQPRFVRALDDKQCRLGYKCRRLRSRP